VNEDGFTDYYELLEFHLWYLKAKGWVERLDTGHLAISAPGVDQVKQGRLRPRNNHMRKARDVTPEGADQGTVPSGSADAPPFPEEIASGQ
jgi:hypothetical protein